MKYKAIIFDIDGTIIEHVSSWQYIHEKLGLWNGLAEHYQNDFLEKKISYRRFCELDAKLWKGLKEKRIQAIFKIMPYAKNAAIYIKKLKAMGFKLFAVSTGLQYMADRLKKELKFDYVISNRLLAKQGLLTGKVDINITHGAKGKILTKLLKKFSLKVHEVISVGDSAGDMPLAQKTGYSIAFNSSSKILTKIVDYNCKKKDFKEIFGKIVAISKQG